MLTVKMEQELETITGQAKHREVKRLYLGDDGALSVCAPGDRRNALECVASYSTLSTPYEDVRPHSSPVLRLAASLLKAYWDELGVEVHAMLRANGMRAVFDDE